MDQQDDDLAKAAMDADDAQVAADQSLIDASKQTIQSAQDQIGVTQAQLGSAKDQARQALAAVNQAKINLAHTRITAPVDGTVIARRMDVGQTAAASFAAPTVFEIAQDLTKMQVDTNVDDPMSAISEWGTTQLPNRPSLAENRRTKNYSSAFR